MATKPKPKAKYYCSTFCHVCDSAFVYLTAENNPLLTLLEKKGGKNET
jgi:hypothetical protein